MDLREISSRRRGYKALTIILVLLFAVIFALTFDINGLDKFLRQFEPLGYILSLFAYVLLGLVFIPAEPVTFLLLAWKGPWVAILTATLGNTLTGLVVYFIGGNIGEMADFEKKKANLPFHLGRLPIDSPTFMILTRVLPGFGSKFIGIAGGLYKVSLWKYLWTSVVANALGAAVVVLVGTGLIALIK